MSKLIKCAGGCGWLIHTGRGSLPEGEATCRVCRRERPVAKKCGPSRNCPDCGKPLSRGATHCRSHAQVKTAKKPRFYIPESVRQAVFEHDDWVCWICGTYVDTICGHNDELAPTIDHIIPRSKGGGHEVTNLRTAHRNCNGKRGNRVA